jgi:NADH-quinone oxidoreductase subunit C
MPDLASTEGRDIPALIRSRFSHALSTGPGPIGDQFCWVTPAHLVEVVQFVKNELGFDVLMDETCVDYPDRDPRFDVIYNLYNLTTHERFFIKVLADDSEPGLPTLTGLYRSANWFEREIYDMFGVRFDGHPNLKRILMYDGFEGHPLRKDYDIRHRQPIGSKG